MCFLQLDVAFQRMHLLTVLLLLMPGEETSEAKQNNVLAKTADCKMLQKLWINPFKRNVNTENFGIFDGIKFGVIIWSL